MIYFQMIKSKRNQIFIFISSLFVVFFGQQCSKVTLEKIESIDLFSTGPNPFRMSPPSEMKIIRRYVFLIDMSNSMVSGPCLQDFDEFGIWPSNPAGYGFDPNKGYNASPQVDGYDCRVDTNMTVDRALVLNQINTPPTFLPYKSNYKTFKGNDWEGHRITVVQNWLNEIYQDSSDSVLEDTQIMLVPISGGESQNQLNRELVSRSGLSSATSFVKLKLKSESRSLAKNRIDDILNWFKELHESEKSLVSSTDIYRSMSTKFGSTNPGGTIPSVYNSIATDMRALGPQLTYADYQVIHLTDGVLTPQANRSLKSILQSYIPCKDICSSFNSLSDEDFAKNCIDEAAKKIANTPANQEPEVCSSLVSKVSETWGKPDDNTVEKLDFYFGLIQNLPNYFGAGTLRIDLVEVNKQRTQLATSAGTVYFDRLKKLFTDRGSTFGIYEILNGKSNLNLVMSKTRNISFKITNFFIYNPNVRLNNLGEIVIDSDGDGLADTIDQNPINPRSNDYCLDSMLNSEAYGARCSELENSRSCDPSLDSDGDGLNECEEVLLGSNPFSFDTDGDSIPDTLEYLYGFNPLKADTDLDSNGDGYINLLHFTSGIGPELDMRNLDPNKKVQFAVNSKGREKIVDPIWGESWVDLFEIILKGIPVRITSSVSEKPPIYLMRSMNGFNREISRIPSENQLLGFNSEQGKNTAVFLARLIDNNRGDRAYWRIYKSTIPVTSNIKNGLVDLSQLHQIQAIDRGH